jgi:ABC-type multidrug transport system ATPase subunit
MISESILEGVLKIFAIIARPECDPEKRRNNVRKFLDNQLNQVGVSKWLKKFDDYYDKVQSDNKERDQKRKERKAGREKSRKSGAGVAFARADNPVKATPNANYKKLMIVQIIEEISYDLPKELKIIIVIQLLEFCKSEENCGSNDNAVNDFLLDIIRGVAELINIGFNEVNQIMHFVLSEFNAPPDSPEFMIVDSKETSVLTKAGHSYDDCIDGQIWLMFIPSVSSCFVRYDGQSELTILGQPLLTDKVYHLPRGSAIKKPDGMKIYYSDIVFLFKKNGFEGRRIFYEVRNIEYRFRGGNLGLNKISFSEESGKMVGIMGASGSGKSTLLNILNGTNTPFRGEVLINGVNIHKDRWKVKGLIGFVSQDDLLIEDLTVFENLYFNARLCFGNLSEEAIVEKVEETLKRLDLLGERDKKVGDPVNPLISGGQRKRLNIALELIREPAIIFLDEPTSGLSSADSENILGLLDDLTKKGKLIFVVLHQPSSDIFKMFDRLIILDVDKGSNTGGYMIFNGNPLDSIEHFKRISHSVNYTENECHACHNVNPEQIFSLVEARVLNNDGKPTKDRKIKAVKWQEALPDIKRAEPDGNSGMAELPKVFFKIPGRLKQVLIFIERDVKTKLADTQYGIMAILEAPVLAFLLSFIIRFFKKGGGDAKYSYIDNSNLPVYIFMAVIVAVFMGMTLSAEEIIKNRKILKREAFLNLSWNSYLVSKIFVQFLISAIQAFLFVVVGNTIMGIKGMMFEYWIVLFSCWAFSNVVGLLISDSFKAVVTIYILIPFLVIPQILLSGIIVKYEKLNPDISSPDRIPLYGELITARWGYEALAVNQFVNNRYEKQFFWYDKELSDSRFRKDYWSITVKGKLDDILDAVGSGGGVTGFEDDLTLVRNELGTQASLLPAMRFESIDSLTVDKVTESVVIAARAYVENVRKYYVRYYNDISAKKDAMITRLITVDKESFLKQKNDYFNSSLEEFVTNSRETDKIIEYKNRLIWKVDPVYVDPEHNFIKAHFYSPFKKLFGVPFDTLFVNVLVIWAMALILYFALYFRLLKKTIDFAGIIFDKIPH